MFWFLHYAAKVMIGLCLVGIGLVLYLNRQWFAPADAWAETLRRAQTETLPILGSLTGKVIRVPAGDAVVVRETQGRPQTFRLAGVMGPPPSRNPLSERARAFQECREFLATLALSNQVTVSYTFHVPGAGGLGGVYLGGTNLAVPLLEAGLVIVHDPSLKGLPLPDQVRLLAAEKAAREGRRGFWTNTVTLEAIRERP